MSKGGGTKMVESTSGPSKEYETFGKETLSLAAGLGNRGYMPYTGERIAGVSSGEMAGIEGLKNLGRGAGSMDMGHDAARRMTNQSAPLMQSGGIMRTAQEFKDPYINDVVNTTLADLARQNQIALGQVGGSAVGAGGFGGSRHGVAEAETNRNFLDVSGRTAAGLYSGAHQAAMQQAMAMEQANQQARSANMDRQLGAADLMRQTAAEQFNREMGVANAQLTAGQLERDREQQLLDLKYGDFLEEQNHPERMLSIRQSALGMTPMTSISRTPVMQQGLNFGSMAGGIGSLLSGAAALCWVAREVYGADNPRWLVFREWVVNEAPGWFRRLYIKHGEAFAEFIKDKPLIKRAVRFGMDLIVNRKLKGVRHGFAI